MLKLEPLSTKLSLLVFFFFKFHVIRVIQNLITFKKGNKTLIAERLTLILQSIWLNNGESSNN